MCAAAPALGHAVLTAGLLAAHAAAFAPGGWAPTPRVHLRQASPSLPDGPGRKPGNRPPARAAPLGAWASLAMDDLFNSEPLGLNESAVVIGNITECKVAVVSLLRRAARREALGVDVLQANDSISLISVATESGKPVVVFDIHSLQGQAFQPPAAGGGGLGLLLESPSVNKVVFDAGPGADALLLQFDVRLENVWDLRMLYSNVSDNPSPAWALVLDEFLFLAKATPSASEQLKGIADKGFELLWPGNASDREVWAQRPIHQGMLEYAVARAIFLPDMWDYFSYINAILNPLNRTGYFNEILRPLRQRLSKPGFARGAWNRG